MKKLLILTLPMLMQLSAQPLLQPAAQENAPAETSSDIPREIISKVDPSVVSIQHERAGGTGFIISEDGYILSNGHVVRGSDAEDPTRPAKSITVILNDERKFPAKVLGWSMDPDVALLKIEGEGFQPVQFGDSRNVQVGQKCFAVGTPSGLRRTFTSGILSNVERTDLNTETVVFQTDAAINQGNSGGPLFDQQGHVLGINTYGFQGRNNLGFTIPIHVALDMIDDLKTRGRFVRSLVPLYFTSEIYDELAQTLGVESGVLITWVMPGSEAEALGLKSGDILTAIDGNSVNARSKADLLKLEWDQSVREGGEETTLTVLRGKQGEREEITFETTLKEMGLLPQFGRHAGEILEHRYAALGLGVKELVDLHHLIHETPADSSGVLVQYVEDNSTADRAGIQKLDIIHSVRGKEINSLTEFRQELETALQENDLAIQIEITRKKLDVVTALAPDYALKGKKIVLLAAATEHEFVDVMMRELLAKGADLEICVPGKSALVRPGLESKLAADVDVSDASALEDVDLLLIAGGEGSRSLLKNEEVLSWVKDRIENKKLLATVGSAGLIPIKAMGGKLELKITLPSADSSRALLQGATYTGNDIEKDGSLHSSTGEERDVIRKFINSLSNALIM